jgi:hypothetical protein
LSCRTAAGPQLSFDPETAFKVLRSAGYAQHALFVAEQAEQPEWILDVLLEDMGSFPEALAFIGTVTWVLHMKRLCYMCCCWKPWAAALAGYN